MNRALYNASGWKFRRVFPRFIDAETWLQSLGHWCGQPELPIPGAPRVVGVRYGAPVTRWSRMKDDEAEQLDGLVIFEDSLMSNTVTVVMQKDPEHLRLQAGLVEALRLCTADTGMSDAADVSIRLARVEAQLRSLVQP